MESNWLKRFTMHLCPRIVFPSIIQFSHELLPKLVKETKQVYVLPTLAKRHSATSFDLWMSKVKHDVFALMINIFLIVDWPPKHITFSFFEPTNINGQTLAKSLTKLLDNYALRRKNIAYVKDKGSNLNTMTTILKSIVGCDMLDLEESFQGIYFGHAFSKACQYVTIEKKICKYLQYVSIKATKEI